MVVLISCGKVPTEIFKLEVIKIATHIWINLITQNVLLRTIYVQTQNLTKLKIHNLFLYSSITQERSRFHLFCEANDF